MTEKAFFDIVLKLSKSTGSGLNRTIFCNGGRLEFEFEAHKS